MFCMKCGNSMDCSVCSHCGANNSMKNSHNYLDSSEMEKVIVKKDYNKRKITCENNNNKVDEIESASEIKDVSERTLDKSKIEDFPIRKSEKQHLKLDWSRIILILSLIVNVVMLCIIAYFIIKNERLKEEIDILNNSLPTFVDELSTENEIESSTLDEEDEAESRNEDEQTELDSSSDGIEENSYLEENFEELSQKAEKCSAYLKKHSISDLELEEAFETCLNQKAVYTLNAFDYNEMLDDQEKCGVLQENKARNKKEWEMYYFYCKTTRGKQYALSSPFEASDMVYIEKCSENAYYMVCCISEKYSICLLIDNNAYAIND